MTSPMRVLFACFPARSHFYMQVPLAWALRASGHEVRVACQPHFAATVTGAGLSAVPVGRDFDLWRVRRRLPAVSLSLGEGLFPPYDAAVDDRVDRAGMAAGYDTVIRTWHRPTNEPMLRDLVAFARHWRPDLVIWEPVTFAGAVAAAAVGAVHARLLWSLDVFGAARRRFLDLPGSPADPLAEWLAGYAGAAGVEIDEELITGQFTLDPLPEPLALRAPSLEYLPLRYLPYGGDAVLESWLRHPPRRPRVAVSLGISSADYFAGYSLDLGDVLGHLAASGVEVVATVAASQRDGLGGLPTNVRVVPHVALDALAATCDAVVHHAGPGTLLTTARHAVPQVAVPVEFDAPELARRAHRQGSVLALNAAEATGRSVRDAVERVCREESYGTAARRLARDIATTPAPGEIVDRLERRVRDRRPATVRR